MEVYGVTFNINGTVTVEVTDNTEEAAEDKAYDKARKMYFGDLENVRLEWCDTEVYNQPADGFNEVRWSVRGYNKDGSLKEEKELGSELECARYCVAQLRMGYPAPTVWNYGSRVEGY